MNFRLVNVALDIFCIVLSLLLIGYLVRSTDRKERLNRLFIYICLSNIGMLLGDLPNWLCEGLAYKWFPAALWTGILLQYFSGVWTAIAYSKYLSVYLSSKIHINKFNMCWFYIIYFFGIVAIVCLCFNLWNGMFYYIDEGNIYHRGEWWWLSQAIPILIAAINMKIVLHYRKYMTHKTIITFVIYLFIPIPAIILQAFFYGLACTYPATTLAIIVIFLNIQSEQALLIEQKEKELIENRMNIMLSQIQPHFLYNTLTAIIQLCRKDSKKAEEAMIVFSNYLRTNMNSLTEKNLVSFEIELQQIKAYLFLERIRFGDELKIVYDIQNIDFFLPVLTIQPLVENAIKHGIGKKEDGGTVKLCVMETKTEYVITISDDGAGFNSEQIGKDGQVHIGISNVTSRLATLVKGTLQIESQIGFGTTVTVKIPKEVI